MIDYTDLIIPDLDPDDLPDYPAPMPAPDLDQDEEDYYQTEAELDFN